MGKFERNQAGRGKTERVILEDLGRVQHASLSSQIFKVIRTFTDAPAPEYGVASCFISAPDEIIQELHGVLDRAIDEFFAQHGINPLDTPLRPS
jgi:hypothetical protein